MQVRKQQLELDMEQQTGSKKVKEYVKAVYCHPALQRLSKHQLSFPPQEGLQGNPGDGAAPKASKHPT